VPAAEISRTVSSAAGYALEAVRTLGALPDELALYTFSGPPGSTVHLFDRARDQSPDGRLLGPDFPRRARRIHPFTLLVSLHNQVPATLSLELGLRGPSCNAVDDPSAFVDLLPNMTAHYERGPVLAVLSSAADRAEERSRQRHLTGCTTGIEGAIALLFNADGRLGTISPGGGTASQTVAAGELVEAEQRWPFAPCLEPGLAILLALARGDRNASFVIRQPGRSLEFSWSSN
jgi:hypothetical protein